MRRSIASLGRAVLVPTTTTSKSAHHTLSSRTERYYRKLGSVTGRQSSRTITAATHSTQSSSSSSFSPNNSDWKHHYQTRTLCSAFNKDDDGGDDGSSNQNYDTNRNGVTTTDTILAGDETTTYPDDVVDDDDYVNGGDDRYPFEDDDNDDDDFDDDDGDDYQDDYGRNSGGRSRRKGGRNRTDPDGYDNFDNSTIEEGPRRLWLDPKSSITDRVEIFVHKTPLGSLHPLDFSIGSIDLIKQSCKLDSFEGMKYAHDILDRLIDEKQHVNSTLLSGAKANDDGLDSVIDNNKPLVIADRPFKFVMFGWACMSHKVKVGPQRMREVLDLMIQEDEYDKQVRQEWGLARGQKTAPLTDSENQPDGTNDDLSSGADTNIDDSQDRGCEPTVDIYNTLLQGLSNAAKKSIASAIEAEGVLSTMDRMNRTRGWHTRPNTRSYSLVLGAYANTRHATAGDRAEAVLREMTDRHVFEKQAYEDEYGVEYDLRDPTCNRRQVVTPDIVAYTTVMKAYAQSDVAGSSEKALALLTELLQLEESEKNNEDNLLNIQIDSFAFSTVIQAYARMAGKKRNANERFEAAQRAEEIALLMIDRIVRSKEDSKSTLDTNEEEQEQADQTSRSKLTGSIVPFNAAINAWAQSFTKESADRAEALLFRLLEPETQDIIETRPDSISFNSVAQAWAKAAKNDDSAPDRAEEMLKILRAFSHDDTNKDDCHDSSSLKNQRRGPFPDAQTYVAVMNAYANSRRKDRIFHVHRLLKGLTDELPHKVTAIPYTVLFKAVANFDASDSFGPSDSVDSHAAGTDWAVGDSHSLPSASADPYAIALECYTDLIQPNGNDFQDTSPSMTKPKRRSIMKVDHFVFATMMDVIRQHTDSESIERRQRVEEIFYDACQAGQVSSLVLKALQSTCPTPYIQELLQQHGRGSIGVTIETINILPREWTRNVPQDFRRVSTRNDHYRKSSKHFRSQKNTKMGNNKQNGGSSNNKKKNSHERKRQQ